MKNFIRISMLACLLLAVLIVKAQTDDYDNDIARYLQISGATATYDVVFDQMKGQLKTMKPAVPDFLWSNLKTEVFDKEIAELTKQLVPLYKKHFTHAEVKELISFYESPLGKKLATETPKLSRESMQLGQTWGMGLMGKIDGWLKEKGY